MQSGYEVSWCVYVPETEFGDMDVDNAEFKERYFSTKPKAVKFAKTITDKYYGEPIIKPFIVIPYDDGYPGSYVEYGDAEEW